MEDPIIVSVVEYCLRNACTGHSTPCVERPRYWFATWYYQLPSPCSQKVGDV